MMVMTFCSTPAAFTVTMPVRDDADVLALTLTVTVPLLLPPPGPTVNHETLAPSVHSVLDVTVNVFSSPAAVKSSEEAETERVGLGVDVADAWVIVIVFTSTPVALTLMVAARNDADVLASAATVTVPLLLPDAGVMVNHATLALTVQFVLDVTVNVFSSPAAAKSRVGVDMERAGVGVVEPSTVTSQVAL
jgi:hypothetical protein